MSSKPTRYIQIYNGLGSSEESRTLLLHALQSVLDPTFHTVQYITPQQILQGSWMQTSCLIIFGGGYDLGFEAALGKEGVRQIHTFVHGGGSYLGLCAGAYWACDSIQFDKDGPLEVTGERYLKFFPGLCIGPAFPGFHYETKAGVCAATIMYDGIQHLDVYSEGGGYFQLYQQQSLTNNHHVSADRSYTDRLSASSINISKPDRLTVSYENRFHKNRPIAVPYEDKSNINILSVASMNQSRVHSCISSPQSTHCNACLHSDTLSPSVEILATYSGLENNPPAIVKCQVGRGLAILSGVHIEFACHLLDQQDVYVKPWMARFQATEHTRLVVFKDILTQLGIQCQQGTKI